MFVMTAFGSSETHKLTWLQSCEPWSYLLPQAGVRRRAELLYQQLDGLQALRREVRPSFAALCFNRCGFCISAIKRAARIGPMQGIWRSKRQLWTYSGLGIETHNSAHSAL